MKSEAESMGFGQGPLATAIRHELEHLQSRWLLLLLLGVVLVLAGTAAIVVPAATVGTTFAVAIFLGVLFLLTGTSTIVSAFWIGNWSGFLVQLLIGILYVACGFVAFEKPGEMALAITVFIAVVCIVIGVFRTISALVIRYPQWGWALVNGVITLVMGIVIYRNLPFDSLWVIGLLVGIEMLFNGWTWIMLALAIRSLPLNKSMAA